MEIDIANIISAAGTLLAAYFAYNQYTKNKLTDLKVEYFKKEEERRSYHRSENSAKVFGELWRVLYETKADRYISYNPILWAYSFSFGAVRGKTKRYSRNA